jgi:hypothetical protein
VYVHRRYIGDEPDADAAGHGIYVVVILPEV